ncbi:AraC family transcriptional regulator [Variovorax sp. OV329]|uniref:AraC family transcriptional regulator n=1 Tax=Variovorax sp. OV329 TaxID=1882825 RepID=UPI0008EB6E35|nr:AraC family transcriptional regulator [Variovorax sp. OV329]SFM10644.1 AraC-type DNA-binding protein [Variovorax sp. OV329]
MGALVRAAALTNFSEVVRGLGHDPGAALRRAGLRSARIRDPDQLIEARVVAQLLEDTARATGCESIGLRMAEQRQLSNFGVVGLLLVHQPTLRHVLLTLIGHVHMLNESLAMQLEDAGEMVILREDLMSAVPARQSVELAIGVLFRMCGALLGTRWKPVSVCFAHGAPADAGAHRRMFRCRVEFDAEFTGIVCRAADLDVPNPSADPVLARYALTMVDALPAAHEQPIEDAVRKAIYLVLPSGRATCESVAQGLGFSMRTLQRALDERGASFSKLLGEVRQELAQRYVDSPRYSLGQVASLLGYSTHSAFTRWFGARFGRSPEAWRAAAGTQQTRRKPARPM